MNSDFSHHTQQKKKKENNYSQPKYVLPKLPSIATKINYPNPSPFPKMISISPADTFTLIRVFLSKFLYVCIWGWLFVGTIASQKLMEKKQHWLSEMPNSYFNLRFSNFSA